MKTFDLERYGNTYKIQLNVTSYTEGNLAVTMTSWEDGEPEPWNVLTINLGRIILTVITTYIDAGGTHMNDYSKITALYSRLSVGDEDRDGGESNSIQNQDGICQG